MSNSVSQGKVKWRRDLLFRVKCRLNVYVLRITEQVQTTRYLMTSRMMDEGLGASSNLYVLALFAYVTCLHLVVQVTGCRSLSNRFPIFVNMFTFSLPHSHLSVFPFFS